MSISSGPRLRHASARLRASLAPIALIVAAASLTGCGINRTVVEDDRAADSRLRHQIALVEQPYTLDVFPAKASAKADRRTSEQIAEFARRYRQNGGGPISIMAPQSGPGGGVAPATIESLRRELALGGANAPVQVSHYAVADPALAAPVRLSFDGLKAKVVHRCGDWPSDLASGSSLRGWDNKTYWNFGCANQNMLAAQAADPRDIAGPRGETPVDTTMRMRAIGAVQKGQDPITNWSTKNSNIGAVGG